VGTTGFDPPPLFLEHRAANASQVSPLSALIVCSPIVGLFTLSRRTYANSVALPTDSRAVIAEWHRLLDAPAAGIRHNWHPHLPTKESLNAGDH